MVLQASDDQGLVQGVVVKSRRCHVEARAKVRDISRKKKKFEDKRGKV